MLFTAKTQYTVVLLEPIKRLRIKSEFKYVRMKIASDSI